MKQLINKKFITGISLAALIFTGCSKDYLDINNDPNRVTDENVTPELIFTQAEQAVGALPANNYGFLDNWMGYFAPNGDFAPNQTEQTYKIDFSFSDPLWQNSYNVLFDLYKAKQKALAQGNNVLAAANMILSAKVFQELVDLYGNIPYSQAFKTETYSTPTYDDAKTIYNDLLATLDTAVSYMDTAVAPTSFGKADIIAAGDQVKWTHFANTLRLRLAIRQSQVSGFDHTGIMTAIQNSGGILTDGENVAVNPGYANDVNKQSPFFANFGYDPTGVKANTSTGANDYIVSILSSTNDPRLRRFFQPVGENFNGNIYGDATGSLFNGANTSYFGPGLIGDTAVGGTFVAGATQAQWIYPAYEALFLKAEAVARGWMSGDVKSAYEDAVTQSFIWLGAKYTPIRNAANTLDSITFTPTQSAAIYLADSDNVNANWIYAGSSVDDHVQFIVFQKYIANTGVDPLESYSDERRLHFLPDGYISTNPAAVSNTLPLRLLYPQSEYTTNAASVGAEGSIDAFSSKIFWEP